MLIACTGHRPDRLGGEPGVSIIARQFIAERRRTEKARRYAELAALATAPLGGLWPTGWTGENLARPPLRVIELMGEPGAAGHTPREP